MNENTFPVGVCVAVKSLRPKYNDLEHFLSDPANIIVCRRGRIWITDKESGTKKIYVWKDSPWANPYKLTDYSLDESLQLYSTHLDKLLENEAKKSEFLMLKNASRIGCFCSTESRCHRDVILAKLLSLLASK